MKNEHPAIEADLKAFLDGELPVFRRLEIARHLKNCPACRQELELMEQFTQSLQTDEPPTALSPELRAQILENAPKPPHIDPIPSHTNRLTWPKLAAAGAVCLVLGMVFYPVRPRENARRTTYHDQQLSSDADSAPYQSGTPFQPSAQAPFTAPDWKTANRGMSDSNPTFRGMSDSNPAFRGMSDSNPAFSENVRQIHRTGSLSVVVSDIEKSSAAVETLVTKVGGFIAQNSLSTGSNNARVASLELRVPTAQFNTIVQKIGALGQIRAKNVSGEDITANYAGTRAQRDVLNQQLAVVEARMRAAKSGTEKRAVLENQVVVLRARTAEARAQFQSLQKLATLANLSVSLQEQPKTVAPATFSQDIGKTGREAWSSFQNAARLPVQLLIWILAYCPLWIPALLIWKKWGKNWLTS